MALVKKKPSGAATAYVSRKQALKKLQLSLKDFRRLCILKGIYPVEPRHKKKANNNNSANKTYYHLKDVQFLMHEPLIAKFRAMKVFIRRLKKTIGKQDQDASNRLRENEPTYKLDHIVKERYPIFIDALRDLDDAISMCYLFSTFPRNKCVKPELIHLCRRLTMEFLHYVIESRSLRKVFISIKGFYYQAEIMGVLITWIVPHTLGHARPEDVDFKIMVTFTEFYSTMLGFVNYKLFNTLNITYPPKLQAAELCKEIEEEDDDDAVEYIASLNHRLKTSLDNVFEDEVQLDEFHESEEADDIKDAKKAAEKKEKLKKLFENCKIFLNREVPRESLVFIIRCFGGDVSFDKTIFVGSTFEESDELITHQIIDRPMSTKQYLNRFYVQPQWIYDSVNACMLLPVEMYFPGETLPPHLSPFVEEREGDYIPPEKQALLNMQNGISKGLRTVESGSEEEASSAEEESDVEGEEEVSEELHGKALATKKDLKMKVVSGVPEKTDDGKLAQKQAAEDKRLAIMMMPKKKKHLYNKIIYGQKRKNREALKLKEKREEYERSQKRQKINIHS